MKLTLLPITIDLRRGNILDVDVTEPGIPRHVMTMHVAPSPVLINRNGERPQGVVLPCILVEVDPELPKRKHRYCVIDTKHVLDLEALGTNRLEYIGTLVNPNDGVPLAIYEVPADQIALVDARQAMALAAGGNTEQPTS